MELRTLTLEEEQEMYEDARDLNEEIHKLGQQIRAMEILQAECFLGGDEAMQIFSQAQAMAVMRSIRHCGLLIGWAAEHWGDYEPSEWRV